MSTEVSELAPAIQGVVDELSAIIAVDGARFEPLRFTSDELSFDLVLTSAECEECVMPRETLESIFNSRLEEVDASPPKVTIRDPRETSPTG
jgi:hypothetical protein